MTATVTQKLPVFNFNITSLYGRYSINVKGRKLYQNVVKMLHNPRIKKIKVKYPYLTGL